MSGNIVPFRATGPRTDRGKRIASVNALRHGLYASAVVVRGIEDLDEYQRFARQVVIELNVQGGLEMALAERIVSALWRLRRVRRYETEQLCESGDKAVALLKAAEEQDEIVQRSRAEDAALWSIIRSRCGVVSVEQFSAIESALVRILGDEGIYEGKLLQLCDREKPARLKAVREALREAVRRNIRATGLEWRPDATAEEYMIVISSEIDKLRVNAEKQSRGLRAEARSMQISALLLMDDDANGQQARTVADVERRLERQLSRALDDFWKHRGYNAGALNQPQRSGRRF